MESQTQLNAERAELVGRFKELAPEFMAAEFAVLNIAYQDGALPSKVKRLIALAMALKVGCTNCILSQTESALKAGATKDEVIETLQVAVAMGGTTGIAECLRVIKFLDEQDKL